MLGQYLITNSIINEKQLEEALNIQKKNRKLIGSILLELGYCFDEDIAKAIAKNSGLPYFELNGSLLEPSVIKSIPVNLAIRNKMIPVSMNDTEITIACANLPDPQIVLNLKRITKKNIAIVIACEKTIQSILLERFSSKRSSDNLMNDSGGEAESISSMLDKIIVKAVRGRSTDIHFEPERSGFKVRFRVDGFLSNTINLAKDLHSPLISRIKILSGLDIAERRLPQDGSFVFRDEYKDENIDIRVSILPLIYGEKCVIRLLPSNKSVISLQKLGMRDEIYEKYARFINRPHGIILITGPTGSGKTTTLASSLAVIKSEHVNITTIEDPVEYKIHGINQTMVDRANKVTFASALRSILRQDPDIIMIGEIRDKETADIALRSALTGHLVFSTLHTNDAASALTRLIDMGCEPFLVSATICAVMAQRLVRLNCTHCKQPFTPSYDQRAMFNSSKKNNHQWYKGTGCRWCQQTGTRGRIGVFELLDVNSEIKKAVTKNSPAQVIREIAVESGMQTLRDDSYIKIEQGLIPYEEALRVTVSD